MTDAVSVDLGSALPYLEEKIRALFGRSSVQVAARQAAERHARIATRDAAYVQVAGMDRPISIFEIYQPTKLVRPRDPDLVDFYKLLEDRADAMIFGGPGRGKTMLMRYLFSQLLRRRNGLPLLFTLRWPGAVDDFKCFIEALATGTFRPASGDRIILLIDGFDEVTWQMRNSIAASLRDFVSLGVGNFYLTCRSFYGTHDIKAEFLDIAPFDMRDARRFTTAFARVYRSALNSDELLDELVERGFADFAEHPLMLTLVCILKSGSMPELPRTKIGLIRRAVDTLTFRWDDAKGVNRESRLRLDGEDRMRCLLRVAFAMHDLVAYESIAEHAAAEYLELIQRTDISANAILLELAQWYGLLVPVSDNQWSFVHRTIHDFLAARYWVESGRFVPSVVHSWTTRAAYAACIAPDATQAVITSLRSTSDTSTLLECLENRAPLDSRPVANALFDHFGLFPESWSYELREGTIAFASDKACLRAASPDLLSQVFAVARLGKTRTHEGLLWWVLLEFYLRQVPIDPPTAVGLWKRFGTDSLVDARSGRYHAANVPLRVFLSVS